MQFSVQAIGFAADPLVLEFIDSKLPKLATFYDNIISVIVTLTQERETKITNIKVSIPRNEVFVKSTSKVCQLSFTQAFESAVNKIKRIKNSKQNRQKRQIAA